MSSPKESNGESGSAPLETPGIIANLPRWLVVNKPPGWLVIPGRSESDGPVLREWVEREIGSKLLVVHRIDRETSGVVLFARDADAHRDANKWFSNHEVRKTYELLAHGLPAAPILRIADPIAGAPSVTQLEIRQRFGSSAFPCAFLGRARPLSGRRHQIRIHLAARCCPILGDTRYGGMRSLALPSGKILTIARTALHASRLELPTGEKFEAPWPADFASWVEQLSGELAEETTS
jgi:23S rRNA-/tRNA-specific pseudouridylate synthase